MIVVSTEYGYVLVFQDENQMAGLIKNLQAQLAFVRANNIKPPHLLMHYSDVVPPEKIKAVLNLIKPDELEDFPFGR